MLCLHITLELAPNLVSIELAWVLLGVSANLNQLAIWYIKHFRERFEQLQCAVQVSDMYKC